MAIFGTKVYIIEKEDRLLPNQDAEVGELMERVLREQKGITTLAKTDVLSVTKDRLAKRVIVSRGGVEKSVRVDEILIAAGRAPNVDLGLENAMVKYTPEGIEINEYLQTSAKHIFAAGDVLGHNEHTHSALLESRIAANNILHKTKAVPDYTATPKVIFTYPGIASVGLNEGECLSRKLEINKAIAPLNSVSRSNTADFRDGFVKIITNKKGIVLGATVVAPHAGEMIHELALAVKYKLTADNIAQTPHAFLSWSEAIRVAAAKLV
jgi:pyruvate/2-oxoglutarate dehydrogenase complex dihydrolipoamide dehydrogenase (E3) component